MTPEFERHLQAELTAIEDQGLMKRERPIASPQGAWVEVQSGPLGPLRGKLARLLPERRVRIIKPVVIERRIVRQARAGGAIVSSRRSPRRVCSIERRVRASSPSSGLRAFRMSPIHSRTSGR